MEDADIRISRLIDEVTNNLSKKVKIFLKEINVEFHKFNSGEFFFHHMYGCVSKNNPRIVNLNFFNLPELSDSSIKGLIAHELGHVYTNYGRDNYFNMIRNFLTKKSLKKLEEKRADDLAIKWGFKKDIKSLKKEGIFRRVKWVNDGTIDCYNESKLIGDDEKRVDIHFRCENCKIDFLLQYSYHDLNFQTDIFLFRNGHMKGAIEADYPIHYKKLIENPEEIKCEKCDKKLTEVGIVKNPLYI